MARSTPAGWTFLDEQPFGRDRLIQKHALPNGLTAITLEDPAADVFAYHTWFRVGSRHEKQGRTGMAHLFEHMMFKATESMEDGEFDKLMERRGAQTNAATWVDWTYYHEALPATGDNLETAIRLEADRMENLVVDETQLAAEREVVKNERLYRVDDDPSGKMYEELYDLALKGHPYGWPTIGWMPDIEAITVADCQAFYKAYYAPNNAVIVLVGRFDTHQGLELIRRYYGGLDSQELPAEAPAPAPTVSSPRYRELSLEVSTERLLVGYMGPSMTHDDMPALDVAVEVLFGGESSRLHRRLVIQDETASSVDGWVSHFALSGLIEVAATTKAGHSAAEVETVVLAELARFGEAGPTERELAKARNQLEVAVYRSNYAANAVAGRLGHYEVTAGDFKAFSRAVAAVREVTADDVKRVMTRYFQPQTKSVVVVKPAKAAA